MVAGLVAFKNGYTVGQALRDAAIGGVTSAMGAIFILLAVGALIGSVEHGWHHPHRRLLRHRAAAARDLLRRRGPHLCRRRRGHRQLVDHRRHPRRRLPRHGTDPRHVDDDRRRRRDLRRLHGRQDVAAVGDHRARAQPRRWCDGQSAHPRHVVDGRPFVHARVRRLSRDRHHRRPRLVSDRCGPGPRHARRRRSTSRRSTCCPWRCSSPSRSTRSRRSSASSPSRSSPASSPASPNAMPSRRSSTNPDQGVVLDSIEAIYQALANGFESASGNATIDGLFSSGGMSSMLTTVWLILGALSFAAIMEEAGFLNRLIAAHHQPRPHRRRRDHIGRRDQRRPQRRHRRPVRRRRPAQPGVPDRVRPPWPRPSHALQNGRGHRHRHVAARPMEQLWRLHDRRARRADGRSTCRSPSSTSSTRSSPSPTRSPASASSTSPVATTPAADDTPAAGVDDPPALIPEGDGHVE